MIQLAHHDLEDVVDISILRPEQLDNLRTFLSHHGKLIIGVEQVLYDRFRNMMGRSGTASVASNRPQLVDILGQDDKELAREQYFSAMEDVPRGEGEGSREQLLEELMAAFAWL